MVNCRKLDDEMMRILKLRAGSSSDDEFRLKLAAAGGAGPLTKAVYALYRFRSRRRGLADALELGVVVGGAAGCVFASALEPGFGAVCLKLLFFLLVMAPTALQVFGVDDFFARLMRAEAAMSGEDASYGL